jgi:hypothetical protein
VFGADRLSWLPVLPYGPYSKNRHLFNGSIFDPGTFGQLLWSKQTFINHLVGREIIYNGLRLAFRNTSRRGQVAPYAVVKLLLTSDGGEDGAGDGEETMLCNLHVAEKNTYRYRSDSRELTGDIVGPTGGVYDHSNIKELINLYPDLAPRNHPSTFRFPFNLDE